jgi:glyoxylase-like metal-dependent hydrolase (beta-lactamase superfamily II)
VTEATDGIGRAGGGIDGSGTARARCVLAPNPSPMTLDGTNTWLLGEPGADHAGDPVVVVDPGPEHEGHLRRVLAAAGGREVALVLLTHGHADHAAGARRFAELAGARGGSVPVRALDPAHRLGGEGLTEGAVVTVAGLEIEVLETPGHSADSLCFWLPADRAVLTGDTVLGRGTTMIAQPRGLGHYLRSLDRLRALADTAGATAILPGHGPLLRDPIGALDHYIAHRRERLAQVEAAVTAGARTPKEVVRRVYADVDRSLWPAAEESVRAQLDYLGVSY